MDKEKAVIPRHFNTLFAMILSFAVHVLLVVLVLLAVGSIWSADMVHGAGSFKSSTPPYQANIPAYQNPICGTVELVSGPIEASTAWSTSHLYLLNSDVTVNAGVTLTIQPGVVIKAKGNARLYVNGKLVANGTTIHPVYFTSWKDDALCGDTNSDGTASVADVGDWGWIEFGPDSDPASSIQYAEFHYGGFYNAGVYGVQWNAPIRLNKISPTLENITFQDNYRNAVEIMATNWTSTSWDSTTVVYWLRPTTTILQANTLSIPPNVKIKATGNAVLYVNGKLTANGSQSTPIIFTSDKDDSVCGEGVKGELICDTNNDDTASVADVGDWSWIEFGPDSDPASSIQYAEFHYGGLYNAGVYGMNWCAAVRLDTVSPTISYSLFKMNYRGLDLLSGSQPSLVCNDFEDNRAYGMYNYEISTIIVAEHQWWNSPTGPTHPSNPEGAGDPVSDGIDYTPWATQSCVSPGGWRTFLPLVIRETP
jgi:hypothetical protein